MSNLIVGLDFETTGTSPQDDRIVEVGAVLYEWETGTPLRILSSLVTSDKPMPEEATLVNGITDQMIADHGRPKEEVFAELSDLLDTGDYAMAHFGSTFDRLFYDAAVARGEVSCYTGLWLDTATDIKWPKQITTRNLRHLASEFEFCNPFAHRAVFDVLTMLKIANRFKLEDIVARSKEPTVFVQAHVTFDEKELAKDKGYGWCGPKKIWWKKFKQSDYEAEKQEYGFRTSIMAGSPE